MTYNIIDCTSTRNCKSECGNDDSLTATHGNISTPHFPSTLPPFSRCSWTITLPTGVYIELRFTEFSVEETDDRRCIDWVSVLASSSTTSPTSAEGRRPWEYCGEMYPLVVSDISMVSVEFRIGLDSKSLGFLAQYTATGRGVNSVSKFPEMK